MTDAEINLAIAKIEHPDNCFIQEGIWVVDYCNNWSDIGPIIEREKIALEPLVNGWDAGGYGLGCNAEAETPTKAAALCFLKMKGE